MFGYAGKLLFVDLSDRSFEIRDLDPQMARDYVSGASLGARILYEEMPAHTDPFAPESMLGFVSGVTNANGVLFGGRYSVCSKSPVTGGWNDANAGGYFGPDLKKAGFDGVFVKGIADAPVYIWIDNGEVEIRDASKYWGMMVSEAEKAFRNDIGDEKINMAMIGPGGETMSYMSSIINDGHRAAARGGTGAVMGSKKLKAVVVRGNQKIEVADKTVIVADNKRIKDIMNMDGMREACEGFGDVGTAGTFDALCMNNDASIKNWDGKAFVDYTEEEAKCANTTYLDKDYKIARYGCSTCPMRCGAIYKVDHDKWPMEHAGRPEYESAGAFSSACLVNDGVAMLKCNDLCNEAGLDTISVGNTVAWAMECYENGLITKDQTDGIELNWGNADAMVALTEKIALGEGCGKIFGLGSYHAAKTLGVGMEYTVTARGMEFPMHDARLAPGLGRTYQFDPTPSRHVKGTSHLGIAANPDEIKHNYDCTGWDDLLGTVTCEIDNNCGWCYFGTLFGILVDGPKVDVLNAMTGFNYTRADYHNLGVRMYTIRHAFNLREGLKREDCFIADRMIKGNDEKELWKGVNVDTERLMDNFLNAIGYDKNMIPFPATLDIVGGLDLIRDDLYGEN